METISVYVLLEIKKAPKSEAETAVGVTTDLAEADTHKAKNPVPSGNGFIEFGYKEFSLRTDLFVMGAESTQFLKEMTQYKEVVDQFRGMVQGGAA